MISLDGVGLTTFWVTQLLSWLWLWRQNTGDDSDWWVTLVAGGTDSSGRWVWKLGKQS